MSGPESLLQAIALTKDDVAKNRRIVKDSLVRASLSRMMVGDSFTPTSISSLIQNSTGFLVPVEVVAEILEQMRGIGIIRPSKNGLYILERKVNFKATNSGMKLVWGDFVQFAEKKFPDFDHYLNEKTKRALEEVLLEALCLNRGNKEAVFTGESISENINGLLYAEENPVQNISEKERDLIVDYLGECTPILDQWLIDNYSVLQYCSLIENERLLSEINFNAVEYLAVDTSFIVALICKTSASHQLATALANACHDREIKLVYFTDTKIEMQRLIKGSHHEMSGLQPQRKSALMESQFVKECIRRKLNWPIYSQIVDGWQTLMKDEFEMEEIAPDADADAAVKDVFATYIPIVHREKINKIMRRNPRYIGKDKSIDQINHDAHCMGLIKSMQNINSDKIGPWFITLDTILVEVNNRLPDKYPLVLHAKTMLEYFVLYAATDVSSLSPNEMTRVVVKHVIGHPKRKNLEDDYINYTAQRLGIDIANTEILNQILLKHPLSSDFRAAIHQGRRDKADSIVMTVAMDAAFVDKIVENSKLKDRIKEMGSRMKDVVDENNKLKRESETAGGVRNFQQNITISQNNYSESNMNTDLASILAIMDAMNAFTELGLSQPPPTSEKKKLAQWIDKTHDAIIGSKKLAASLHALIPSLLRLKECIV